MAREPDKKPDTGTPLGPKTGDAPLVIKTNEILKDAKTDPRGDNRPGVLPDQPAQEGIDPVTNLREDLVDKETLTPKAITAAPTEPLNPAVQPKSPDSKAKGGSTRKVRMRVISDIWPRDKPEGWPEDREYRVRANEEVDLPEDEAMDRMEAGTAVRAEKKS